MFCAALISSTTAFADDAHTVNIVSPWEVSSYALTVAGYAIQSLEIMENLADADENGVLRPRLATGWTASDDGLSWTFDLRDGVTFHDGTAFDAAAAASVLERAWRQPGVFAKG